MNELNRIYNLEKLQEELLASDDDKLDNLIELTVLARQQGLNQILAIMLEQLLKTIKLRDTMDRKYVLYLVNKIKDLTWANAEEFRTWNYLTSEILLEMERYDTLEYYYRCLKLLGEIIVCNNIFR